ncbi:MAG: RluA family pseudouridine synthase [Phycisphaerales bacterium]
MTTPVPNPAVAVTPLLEAPDFLVVAKAPGVVTEPGRGHPRDSLLNGLMVTHGHALRHLGEARDWGLLHRLDRDTSGAIIVALTAEAYDRLRAQFEARRVGKRYLAAVRGAPVPAEGSCEVALREEVRAGVKVCVPARRGGGQPAVTRWRTLARAPRGAAALLEVSILTGRLHQIRVHLSMLGVPVIGDRMYRSDLPPNTSPPPRGRPREPLLLHAWRLSFQAPDGRPVEVTAPLPAAFRAGAEEAGIPWPSGVA